MSSNRKYRNALYPIRRITDIKQMLTSSAKLFRDAPAYLIKKTPGGRFTPVSYIQLKNDVDAMGTALIDLGLKDRHIAVIGETRYEWMIGNYGVVCGTGVVVPLDKDLPIDELKNMIHRAHLSAIIYSGKVEDKVLEAIQGEEGIEYIISMDASAHDNERLSMNMLLEEGHKLVRKGDRRFIDAQIDPEAMSILLFTSGTTGLAKGVMLSHKNIVSNVMSMSQFFHVYTDDITLSILPIHHTYEYTCDHMTVLYQGGTIAICEGLKHIVSDMNEVQATVMLGVPLVYEMMYKRVWKQAEKTKKADKLKKGVALAKRLDRFNIKAMKKLFKDVHSAFGGKMRCFISGAAAIDPEIIDFFNYIGINMIQGYGMTESSPIIALNRDRYHKSASAGQPLPGTEIRIFEPDEDGVGEVLAKSDSVMLGYYEDQKSTDEAFMDGWLRTGDYGYLDGEGFLFLTGRKKNVIVAKNGKNVFPEEVEYYLLKSPYIAEAIVTGDDDGKGDLVVTAHIVPDEAEIKAAFGELDDAGMNKLFKKVIRDTNDMMPAYKRVKKVELRKEEFIKTSTHKIRRNEQTLKSPEGAKSFEA